jgi:hypothetical protein
MKTSVICFLVIVLAVIAVANAQIIKPQAPAANQIMKDLESSVAIKVKAAEIEVAAQMSALAKPETAEKMARYVKNFQNALIKEGFSKEEALKIVTSMPLPTASK